MIRTMFRRHPGVIKAVRFAALCLMVGTLTACQAVYRNHGYIPTPEELALVTVGADTRESVSESIGAPSSSGVLNDDGYYYVASRIRHRGATRPTVVSRSLVAITFDQRGVVRNIERFGLEQGRLVVLERAVTSSSVQNKTFLRQLLGNLGNFNPGALLN